MTQEEETPLVGASDSTNSPPSKQHELWGRRISLFLARIFPKYGQHASLEQAWNYFEYISLPRRIPVAGVEDDYTKAPPGTPNSTLFPAWTTPQRELNDFGTGVAVYFETLRALVVVCLVAGLLYIPSMMYYSSTEYASDSSSEIQNPALAASLICTDTKWVPCPNCTVGGWSTDSSRFATSPQNANLTFILKNDCASLEWQQGMNHFGVLCFLILAIVALGFHQKKLEQSYDEDVLTASDYSIVVKNPPHDATDPKEWKEFFSQFGSQVVYVTVALDNDALVKALSKRRALLQKASFQLEGWDMNQQLQEIPSSLSQKKKLLYKKLVQSEEKCRDLAQKTYPSSAVFCTFETEQCQRTVLQRLTVGTVRVATNDASTLDPNHVFRDTLVLDVEEAVEPSAIRWKDLHRSMTTKILQRICTAAITIALIGLGFIAVKRAFQYDVHVAAYLIAVLNILVPNILKLVNNLESHSRQGTFQASLYAKISVFRFINTAIVTTIIKPFTSTIAVGETALIPAVYAVLKAEIVTAPVLHMCDIVGQVKRFILAPRAANQAAMNSYFRGSIQNLGEKYTNMTKIIFLCCFYSTIFPASWFFGAVAIAATYATDKFLLMRSWAPLPKLGDDVALLSRRVFFPLTLVTLVVVSEFYWSAYPFDDACDSDMIVSNDSYPEYIGTHTIATTSGESFDVTITGDGSQELYQFCDQDYLERVSALLHFFQQEKDDWMSPDQELLTYLFGILCVIVLVILGCVALLFDVMPNMREVVGGDYMTTERDSGESFTEQEHINAYVPQVENRRFSYPLLACDGVNRINHNNIGWTDPVHSHDFYDMSNDVAFLLNGKPPARPVLSSIRYWKSPSSAGGDTAKSKDS